MPRNSFSRKLLLWSDTFDRKMPWKERSDAYAIWLSEIILQQTRVAQGMPYYIRFLEAFPTVFDLAKADEQEVMRLWQGLGYYSRARNLHFTAQQVANEFGGKFPDNYADLLALKGIGPYTAAAIASFAFGLPHAVVDGNVFRVLARYTANFIDIGTPAGKKEFTLLANQLLDKKQPGKFNQAIMDLGALVCKPTNPDCSNCPLQKKCQAFSQDTIAQLPVKEKKIKRKTRYFYYFVFRKGSDYYIQKRTKKDIWQSLYEFPNIESKTPLNDNEVKIVFQEKYPRIKFNIKNKLGPVTQLLTHQKVIGQFFDITLVGEKDLDIAPISKVDLQVFPFPKMMMMYINRIMA